jgi:hypothetical protein
LIPKRGKLLTFGEYTKGFWESGSDYLENQEVRADITPSYIDNCKKMTANQIHPLRKLHTRTLTSGSSVSRSGKYRSGTRPK